MIPDLELLPLFQGLKADHLALLRPLFERVKFAAGDTVVGQGESAEYLYLIERGKIAICYKPYDGESITLTHVEAGGLFGWSAVVGSPHYTSSGIAVEALEAIRVRGSDLRRLCAAHPEAGRAILDRLADSVSARWKDAHQQIRAVLKSGMNG
ncbi:MAG: cyclic nucleotide-binding domain-containing protein [Chloroflexi bacterium]|nr:cyclic nucleotide-binding domain-containing protein [Chloroflexota bacterium]